MAAPRRAEDRKRWVRPPSGFVVALGQVRATAMTWTVCMSFLAVTGLATVGTAQTEMHLAPGSDVLALTRAAPAGSVFTFAPGTYYLPAPIEPKPGDTYRASGEVRLTGAMALGSANREGDVWVVADVPVLDDTTHGRCDDEFRRCDVRHDVYLDGVPLIHVAAPEQLGEGRWYHEAAERKILLGDDPTGRVLEIGMGEGAFRGNANHVTIEGFIIEKFANPAQVGAIHAYGDLVPIMPGYAWVVRNNIVQLNHGTGIMVGYGATVAGNRILRNGQLGLMGKGGENMRVTGNEIAYNNYARFRFHWEGAGAKFRRTQNTLLAGNHVHHNLGPGLWCDYDNIGAVYRDNLVEYNESTGIFHEVSYDALIEGNTVRHNGVYVGEFYYTYVFGSGILVYNSRNVEVTRNVVYGNWNGINGLMHDRGTGVYGVWELRNLDVHHNVIHMPFNPRGVRPGELSGEGTGMEGISGVSQAGGQDMVFAAAYGNRFYDNVYLIADPNEDHWTWGNERITFPEWQACGGLQAEGWFKGCVQDGESVVRFVTDAASLSTTAERIANELW